ncbi:MAG TPA: hypothetical protein PLF56_11710 [Micropruina sp.]|nr:hypothetical protein [Micropruina sp.]
MQPRKPHIRRDRKPAQAAGDRMPVHSDPAPVQHATTGDGTLHSPRNGRRERGEQTLPPAADLQHAAAVLLADVVDAGTARLEIRDPSRPNIATGATSAKSLWLVESPAAASMGAHPLVYGRHRHRRRQAAELDPVHARR